MKPYVITIIFAAVIAAVIGFLYQGSSVEESGQRIAQPLRTAVYECADGKILNIGFNPGQVAIVLSDGSEFTLEQTSSVAGARYANEGDRVVFWTKDYEAYVEENGEKTHENCVYKPSGDESRGSDEISDVPIPVKLSGTYTCLPHKDRGGAITLECALGMQTDANIYFALDVGDNYPDIGTGTKIQVEGLLVPIEQISSDHWQRYDIKGIIKVDKLTPTN